MHRGSGLVTFFEENNPNHPQVRFVLTFAGGTSAMLLGNIWPFVSKGGCHCISVFSQAGRGISAFFVGVARGQSVLVFSHAAAAGEKSANSSSQPAISASKASTKPEISASNLAFSGEEHIHHHQQNSSHLSLHHQTSPFNHKEWLDSAAVEDPILLRDQGQEDFNHPRTHIQRNIILSEVKKTFPIRNCVGKCQDTGCLNDKCFSGCKLAVNGGRSEPLKSKCPYDAWIERDCTSECRYQSSAGASEDHSLIQATYPQQIMARTPSDRHQHFHIAILVQELDHIVRFARVYPSPHSIAHMATLNVLRDELGFNKDRAGNLLMVRRMQTR
ncbi:hypothetical protein GOP47_0008048 [Adiantum capillus-veneris]|uniref:Uncharacterized protein n=1 Tax=Adiantum capillus-veneris TaxID=13818 RepID=A0A9D4ZHP4_ADICA|nr:hypothetical protein GOP47_0008048 [Adiantum capillus-veneris]